MAKASKVVLYDKDGCILRTWTGIKAVNWFSDACAVRMTHKNGDSSIAMTKSGSITVAPE